MDGMDALGRKEGAAGTGRDEHDRMLGGTGGGRRVELVAATNERQQNLTSVFFESVLRFFLGFPVAFQKTNN